MRWIKKKLPFFFLLVFFISLPLSFAESPSELLQVVTYQELLSAIRQTRTASQARVEAAANQEKVREAWETGKLINTHVLQSKRADYGQQVLLQLSKDLDTSDTELGYMLQFARAYPISQPAGKLSWSHYTALLSVNDPAERDALERKAEKEGWSRNQIREEVKKNKAARNEKEESQQENILTATHGKPGVGKIVKATVGPLAGKLVLSLGFSNYLSLEPFFTGVKSLQEGDIVEVGADGTTLEKLSTASTTDLYTYRAYIAEIIDGDTVKAVIDLGFGAWTAQKLRLRGLDAPEINTTDGKEAKAFLESVIASGVLRQAQDGEQSRTTKQSHPQSSTSVLIRTVKSDKYDRYLADLFVDGQYINQILIDEGLAVFMND